MGLSFVCGLWSCRFPRDQGPLSMSTYASRFHCVGFHSCLLLAMGIAPLQHPTGSFLKTWGCRPRQRHRSKVLERRDFMEILRRRRSHSGSNRWNIASRSFQVLERNCFPHSQSSSSPNGGTINREIFVSSVEKEDSAF